MPSHDFFNPQRRAVLLGMAMGGLPSLVRAQTAQTAQEALPPARSLPDELALALRQGMPLVVMVSLDGCVFCRVARQSHLLPLWREGQALVQVNMRSAQTVRDFEGRTVTHDELARRWRVSVTPTLLFFGPNGRELVERMEGAYQPDFYGPYLEDRLLKARAVIRASKG